MESNPASKDAISSPSRSTCAFIHLEACKTPSCFGELIRMDNPLLRIFCKCRPFRCQFHKKRLSHHEENPQKDRAIGNIKYRVRVSKKNKIEHIDNMPINKIVKDV